MKTHLRTKLFAVIACALATTNSGKAADICEAVLNNKAFDINDDKVYHEFRQSSYDALCNTGWKSIQEYNTKSGNLDTSGKYLDIFAGGTHGDALSDQNRFEEDYQRLCTRKDTSVYDRFFRLTHTQNTKNAVDAWSKCVNSPGLFSTIDLLDNSRIFNIEVQFNPGPAVGGVAQGQLELLGFNDGEGFDCKINNESVRNYKPPAKHFVLGCRLTTDENSDQNVGVYINTNYDGQQIGLFKVQSKSYIDLSGKVQQLQDEISRIRSRSFGLDTRYSQKTGPVAPDVTCESGYKVVACTSIGVPGGSSICGTYIDSSSGECKTSQCRAPGTAGFTAFATTAICAKVNPTAP